MYSVHSSTAPRVQETQTYMVPHIKINYSHLIHYVELHFENDIANTENCDDCFFVCFLTQRTRFLARYIMCYSTFQGYLHIQS